jgi:hypothetical protein
MKLASYELLRHQNVLTADSQLGTTKSNTHANTKLSLIIQSIIFFLDRMTNWFFDGPPETSVVRKSVCVNWSLDQQKERDK